ncbi:type II secretion system protein [Halorubrum sp. 2020YC2]|uniref:type II secretion system protein n=1 Tax=Halorubrum sp. 2020YC2 TaxID=2836432 RepID=UPI001BEBCE19|nr:type II secretion system protein [Halorubrum sp. 2020YC2]QWC19323.1 type II secretion system protein [Halorubrum sp. 2020YC2]
MTEDSWGLSGESTASDELRRAVAFLGWDRSAERVVALGYWGGVALGGVVTVVVAAVAGAAAAASAGLAAAVGAVHAIHRAPVWLASLRRTRALGAAPGLVGRLVLRMRLDPSTERAVEFAARTGDGPLAAALSRHERGSADGPTSGLQAFAREWRPWFPAIDRAAALVRTAATAPAERRGRCLDRALDATISGTTDRLASFVGAVRGPISALYAFGVLLPLALIALLPAGAAAGVAIGPEIVAGVYLVALPGGLIAASAWLLSRRPVAFPPPEIDGGHPDVPDRRGRALLVGCALGAAAAVVVARAVAAWAWPVAGVGVGAGSALFVLARPRRAVLADVREVERGLPDAMTVIGGDVAEGVAVETAVANAGERLDGATGDLFERAGRRSDTLRVGVREAFLGRGGPAADVPSPRLRGAVALLAVAAREGRPAGDVLLELADQLESLRDLERDARRQLATVTGTLSNTAAVFAPLVGGATVALATGIDATDVGSLGAGAAAGADALGGSGLGTEGGMTAGGGGAAGGGRGGPGGAGALSVPVLGRIVGTYVLLLAALLTGLATGLERGFDRTLVAYRIGIALPTATGTFLVAFAGAGLLF